MRATTKGWYADGRFPPSPHRLDPIAPIAEPRLRPSSSWARIRYELEEPYRSLVAGAAVLRVLFAIVAGLLTLVIVGGFLRVGVGSVYEAVVALLFLATAVLFSLAAWRFDTPLGWWAGLAACGLTALALLTFPYWASALCAIDGLTKCVPRGAGDTVRIATLPFLAAAGLLLIRRPSRAAATAPTVS